MNHINDLKHAWLLAQTGKTEGHIDDLEREFLGGTGHINDQWLAYFHANGATSDQWNDAAYEFLIAQGIPPGHIDDMWWLFFSGSSPVTGPAFWALTPDPDTYEMLGVREGVGDLTTVHTADLYAPDFEGVYREFGANEPVWSGGRVVNNILTNSTDFADPVYWNQPTGNQSVVGGIDDPFGGTDAHRITAVDAAAVVSGTGINDVSAQTGHEIRCSVWLRSDGGVTDLDIYTGSGSTRWDVSTQVTNEWQRFTISAPVFGGGAGSSGFVLYSYPESVDVYGLQYEHVEGKSNQNPGEYIQTTTAPATKVFANQNGNTVTGNVVTEAVGSPLTETPYLQCNPAATNSCLYSRDLTQVSAWPVVAPPTKTYDQIGLTGEPNTATLLDDASAAQLQYLRQSFTITADTNTHTLKVFIKKDTDEARFPCFGMRPAAGTNRSFITINTATGAADYPSGNDDQSANYEVVDSGDWWAVHLEYTNNSTAAFDITVYPAWAQSLGGALDISATGSIIVGNVELHLNKTIAEVRGLGPIFTTSAAVSTDATVYSFDIANHDDTASWYLEYTTELDPDGSAVSHGLIQTNSNVWGQLGYHSKNAGNGTVASRDEGGITSSLSFSYSVGELLKYGLVSSIADGNKTVRGGLTDWSADGAFIGFSKTSIALGRFNANLSAYGIQFRNLRRYDITSYSEGKTIIDGLMASDVEFTVLDSDGNSFTAPQQVLNSPGVSSDVPQAVLDSDGNSFEVI